MSIALIIHIVAKLDHFLDEIKYSGCLCSFLLALCTKLLNLIHTGSRPIFKVTLKYLCKMSWQVRFS